MNKNTKINNNCIACTTIFGVSSSRIHQKFCSKKCYQNNQNLAAHMGKVNVAKDFIGKTVENLFIEEKSDHGLLKCRCVCGEIRYYPLNLLTSGRIKSCGCYNRQKGRKDGKITAWNKWFRYLNDASKHRNIKFFLTLENVKNICQQNCFYCNLEPQPWNGSKNLYLASCLNKKTKNPDLIFAESKIININGIDRVTSSGCYEMSNVVACCFQCNNAKSDSEADEFKNWIIRCYHNIMKKEA